MPSISTSFAAALSLSAVFARAAPQPQQQQQPSVDNSWAEPAASTVVAAVSSVVTSAISSASTVASSISSDTACNNSPALCSQAYNNITHMGAHNSAFVRAGDNTNNAGSNQYYDAVAALNYGLRLLQVQVHSETTGLHMCHSSCSLFDAGLLSDWLADIAGWIDDNANDVVTILLVNSDEADISEFASAFETAGLAKYGYVPESTNATSEWPTLESMISAGSRMVSFITNISANSSYTYLLPEFDYMFETAYEITSLSGFNSSLDRPGRLGTATEAVSSSYMGLVNHMLGSTITASIYVPDLDAIDMTNSVGTTEGSALGTHVNACISDWAVKPNFVLVDYWNKGDVMAVADAANGLSSSDVSGRTSPDEDSAGSVIGGGCGLLTWVFALAVGVVVIA